MHVCKRNISEKIVYTTLRIKNKKVVTLQSNVIQCKVLLYTVSLTSTQCTGCVDCLCSMYHPEHPDAVIWLWLSGGWVEVAVAVLKYSVSLQVYLL